MTTTFYEGDHVDYLGDGLDGIPPAQGRIVAFASQGAAHVLWSNGPREKQVDIVDLHDLEKSASLATVAATARTVTAPMLVRRVMKREGSAGVLKYLAATHQLDSWPDLGQEVLRFVESRLRTDASMEIAYELLTDTQMDDLIATASRTLLRDLFADDAA